MSVCVRREMDELRPRDRKRRRVVLVVGTLKFHLTRAELSSLRRSVLRFKSK